MAPNSSWYDVLLPNKTQGNMWDQLVPNWSPMVIRHALKEFFKSLCCRSIEPTDWGEYNGLKLTMVPNDSWRSAQSLDWKVTPLSGRQVEGTPKYWTQPSRNARQASDDVAVTMGTAVK